MPSDISDIGRRRQRLVNKRIERPPPAGLQMGQQPAPARQQRVVAQGDPYSSESDTDEEAYGAAFGDDAAAWARAARYSRIRWGCLCLHEAAIYALQHGHRVHPALVSLQDIVDALVMRGIIRRKMHAAHAQPYICRW